MTLLADLTSDVYTLTNRPDLESQTLLAIKKATLKFHTADTWLRDIVSAPISLPAQITPQYQIAISTNFTRWRRPESVRTRNDDAFIVTGDVVLERIEPNDLFDNYNTLRQNVYWVVGDTLNISLAALGTRAIVSYFQLPDITTDSYSSWIASSYSNFIVEEASAQIFKAVGKDNEYQRFQQFFAENLALLRTSEV